MSLTEMGKGFVLALSARRPQPERAYRDWYQQRESNDFGLGAAQFVQVEPNLHVANMIGQHRIRPTAGKPPIRYEAVDQTLKKLAEFATPSNASIGTATNRLRTGRRNLEPNRTPHPRPPIHPRPQRPRAQPGMSPAPITSGTTNQTLQRNSAEHQQAESIRNRWTPPPTERRVAQNS
ncbi:hypothetical protein NSK11_contig00022-0054 [Nocardia seriolae]|uniref:Uncharacterized protein n=1 Tax=Nocardia seriolae TaxID=37332 RepID=A0ABC9YQP8_9NOCA|nr:hypothetical protein NSER024013_23430 [Nocardia seriolae]GAM45686.1 hypothetical protein NS07_v2contig00018-0054 [Nocardia seriolae]GAP27710.1 hypothetical protein NSK11_contig00022-0054 [Nocardia seriolae]